ncbi:MAG: hypothetical protein P8J77_01180 [Flavobacteriales bacterium]|nr:hypothetical protein [Flavobacteriales bacterium]
MKKNLRNILALALGLMTTVSFAQDWNVDSRTRIDMSGDADYQQGAQRATLGATWGGSDWGIHLSTDVHYTINDADEAALPALSVYEVYASTNLFGFADMTIGRQALEYGSGTFLAKNDWADGTNSTRNCVDGMTFAIDNDFVGLDLGLAQRDNGDGSDMIDAMWLNASKSSGDWSANLFYADYSVNDMENWGGVGVEANAMGLDFAYSAMGGALDLNVSYNTSSVGATGSEATEYDMMDVSGTYTVNDDMALTAGRATYGENGFSDVVGLGNSGNGASSWTTHGNIGHLGADQENMYIGGTYNMGAFSLAATMHTVTETDNDDYERKATEVSVGYSLGDNASLSYKLVSDNNGGDEDTNYNWLTLTITP